MKQKRILKIVAIISGIITLLLALYPFVLRFILKYMLNHNAENLNSASSIGIIGGADGPTAIFTANASGISCFISENGFTAICAIISIVSFVLIRKRK